MFNQSIKKKVPATDKQINCINVMNDIIDRDLSFTEEELEKKNEFLRDYEDYKIKHIYSRYC